MMMLFSIGKGVDDDDDNIDNDDFWMDKSKLCFRFDCRVNYKSKHYLKLSNQIIKKDVEIK